MIAKYAVVPLLFAQAVLAQSFEPPRISYFVSANDQETIAVTSTARDDSLEATSADGAPKPPADQSTPTYGRQTKRILYVVPNFNSVSAGTQLPPQSFKGKLMNATEDSFDYSTFIFIGAMAGIQQAESSTPEFGQGGRGYGRYYWHSFVDQADENYFVEGFMPILLRQDTRYYTLGRGGFVKRLLYAVDRGFITRSDSASREFNYSEVIGAGAAAGISNLYYPRQERTWTKTGQRWVMNVSIDVMVQAFREFWPDINQHLFHQ